MLQPRKGILNIRPHMMATPEGDAAANRVLLHSNESAFGPSPHALAAAHATLDTIKRYPDDGAARLEAAIGGAFSLDARRIVCGHGSLIGADPPTSNVVDETGKRFRRIRRIQQQSLRPAASRNAATDAAVSAP